MKTYSKIARIINGQKTSDGAGVSLMRIFGFYEEGLLDPFLLLDFFGSDNPDDFIAGFPWHPHRGIETVTYMLNGRVEHEDSMGNKGIISSGDIQWMTAGSGIIHQEMPQSDGTRMNGFQLWVNLPASHKMMKPRYQEIKANDVPKANLDNGVQIKVIAGVFNGTRGPVVDIVADPIYFDVDVPANTQFDIEVNEGYTVFCFAFEGEGYFDESAKELVKSGQGALLMSGNTVRVTTSNSNLRFIMISGKPINEPIAWRGPIVMNTDEELAIAFSEYRQGAFLK
jgi:redox-sensitive bicupin YhaK (pirin superfamily)